MMQSNQPYQRVENPGVMEGTAWGAIKGATISGGWSAFNHYALTGDTTKMAKWDPHIAAGAELYRVGKVKSAIYAGHSGDILKEAFDQAGNISGIDKLKAMAESTKGGESRLARIFHNATFNNTMKGNIKRVAVGTVIGGILGGLHNASNGVVS